jgi:hypothetical protein
MSLFLQYPYPYFYQPRIISEAMKYNSEQHKAKINRATCQHDSVKSELSKIDSAMEELSVQREKKAKEESRAADNVRLAQESQKAYQAMRERFKKLQTLLTNSDEAEAVYVHLFGGSYYKKNMILAFQAINHFSSENGLEYWQAEEVLRD